MCVVKSVRFCVLRNEIKRIKRRPAHSSSSSNAFLWSVLCIFTNFHVLATSDARGNLTPITYMALRAKHWKKSMKKAAGHLKRLGSENDRER